MGKGLTRLPADTPRTPGPRNVDFQQFCDRLRTDLPGDSHGRGSFDTSARFVAGDPGAKFGAAAPLEYEVTGEIGHPHWELIFEYVLRQCGYLVEFHTVYVMVDNRDLANHKRQDPSCLTGLRLQDGGIVASSSLGLTRRKRSYYFSPFLQLPGYIMCTPPGQAPSSWLPWWQCSLGSTLYCLIAIVYLLLCLKLKICGQRAFLARFPAHSDGGIPQAHPLRAFTRFRTDPQVVYTQHRVCSTRMGQGALVGYRTHSELNAGLIVIFRSSHPPLFDWNAWSLRFRSSPGSVTDEELKDEASRLAVTFWAELVSF